MYITKYHHKKCVTNFNFQYAIKSILYFIIFIVYYFHYVNSLKKKSEAENFNRNAKSDRVDSIFFLFLMVAIFLCKKFRVLKIKQ